MITREQLERLKDSERKLPDQDGFWWEWMNETWLRREVYMRNGHGSYSMGGKWWQQCRRGRWRKCPEPSEIDDLIAATELCLRAVENRAGMRVKPLEWTETGVLQATVIMGMYTVWSRYPKQGWEWRYDGSGVLKEGITDDEASAKAACEADWHARISAALTDEQSSCDLNVELATQQAPKP